MNLDVGQLAGSMLTAALAVLKKQAPEIKEYAQTEFRKIADTIVMIGRLFAAGQINEQEAKLHLQIQTNASRAVLLAVEGLGLLAAEQAINAALGAVKDTVNAALPFHLL